MLSNKVLVKFNSIKLLERYENLSKSFQSEKTLENYDKGLVQKRMNDFGYNFSYNKKEDFFGITEKEGDIEFKINISLKFGIVEPIIWAKNIITDEQYGGALIRVTKLIQMSMQEDNICRIPYPRFSTYEDLNLIIKSIMSLYTDFKLVINEISNERK